MGEQLSWRRMLPRETRRSIHREDWHPFETESTHANDLAVFWGGGSERLVFPFLYICFDGLGYSLNFNQIEPFTHSTSIY